jgi:hypothetical protein
MPDSLRVGVEETRRAVQSGRALLVCSYDDEQKCKSMQLEGAIALPALRSRLASLPKDQEIIFYCA